MSTVTPTLSDVSDRLSHLGLSHLGERLGELDLDLPIETSWDRIAELLGTVDVPGLTGTVTDAAGDAVEQGRRWGLGASRAAGRAVRRHPRISIGVVVAVVAAVVAVVTWRRRRDDSSQSTLEFASAA